MNQFEKLRTLRAFRSHHAEFFGTLEEHHLIVEIGYHQAKGKPLTLKQLFLLDIGSVSTVQRSLRRLKERGLVKHRPKPSDRRAVELTLSPNCVRIFAKYDTVMTAKPPGRRATQSKIEPRHVCGLCDSAAGSRNLLVGFLAKGLKRGDRCVLVAPAEVRNEILAELPHRRLSSDQVLVSEGHGSVDAQVAYLKGVVQAAKKAGQATCLGADMAWSFPKGAPLDAILAIEGRLDVLAMRSPLSALCVYDTRRFSGSDFLNAVKCHRDHARFPIVTG